MPFSKPIDTARHAAIHTRDGLRNAYLLSRGCLIPFLRPFWMSEEVSAGLKWPLRSLSVNEIYAQDLEHLFMKATGQDGVAVATSSGRTALRVALRALSQDRPDRNEVVIPSYSCLALLDSVVECGLVPVFADIGHDLNVSEETVAPHIGEKTLAVVVVHLGGKFAKGVNEISDKAEKSGCVVIEDVCQALGGRNGAQHWGSTAPMAIYSFGLGKNLMATAGGMLVAR